MQRKFISRFSPNRTNPEDLEKIHVQRHDLLQEAVEFVRESASSGNKHHLLFVGPRGCGKTHLLALIVHRVQQQKDLKDHLRIAWLNEDETSTTFLDLLLRIYRALSTQYADEFPSSELDDIYGRDASTAREILGQRLLKRLGKHTVLVLIENLDAVFAQLEDVEQRTWRAFIQDNPVFVTVATAQSLSPGVSDREKPFFGFFDTRHLKPLTVDEARELLQRVARLNNNDELIKFLENPRGRARIHAIHHLSGGNHRLYIVLSDFITRETLDELVRPFEEMVDEQLTPYYQERLRWLSPLQRKIVEFLCQQPRPVPVKEIAERLFATHSTITSQLKQLREMCYVESHPRGRESLYELSEPLMRLSMQVKDTAQGQPLGLIVDFLRVWYEREELENRFSHISPEMPGREYFAAALKKLDSGEPNLRHELLRRTLESVDLRRCNDDQMGILRVLAEESEMPLDRLKYAAALLVREDEDQALDQLTNVIEDPKTPVDLLLAALEGRIAIAQKQERIESGIADCNRVIGNSDASPEKVARALVARGAFHLRLEKPENALDDLARVVELPDVPRETIIAALIERGCILLRVGKVENAIDKLTQAIDLSPERDEVVKAMFHRALGLRNLGRNQEAIADYDRIVVLPDVSTSALTRTLLNRALVFNELGRVEEALVDCTRVIEMPGTSEIDITLGLLNRGNLFSALERHEEAIADFTRIIKSTDIPADQLCWVLIGRGNSFRSLGKLDQAISDYSRVIEMSDAPKQLIGVALGFRAVIFNMMGRREDTINDYSQMSQLHGVPPIFIATARRDLAQLYFESEDWDRGIAELGQGFAIDLSPISSVANALGMAIEHIFRKIAQPKVWRGRVAELLLLCSKHNALTYLGDALVQKISELKDSILSHQGLEQWVAGWESAAREYPTFELPLRLLRVGVDYLKTDPRDEGVLLNLPSEERRILREALGLPPEQS